MHGYLTLAALAALAALLCSPALALALAPGQSTNFFLGPHPGVRTLPLPIPPELAADRPRALELQESDAVPSETSTEPTGLEKVLLQALSSLKDIMTTGSPDLDIPKLDPFSFTYADVDIENPQVTLKGNVSDLSVTGLSTYNVKALAASLSPVAAILNFSVPVIDVKGQYDLKGQIGAPVIGDIPIYGKGDLTASVQGLDAGITVELGLTDEGSITLVRLDAFFNIDDVKVRLDGLYGGQETCESINNILADGLPRLVQAYRKEITESVLTLAREALNTYLTGLHMDSPLEEERRTDNDADKEEPSAREETISADVGERRADVMSDAMSDAPRSGGGRAVEREWDLGGSGRLQLTAKTTFVQHGALRRH